MYLSEFSVLAFAFRLYSSNGKEEESKVFKLFRTERTRLRVMSQKVGQGNAVG